MVDKPEPLKFRSTMQRIEIMLSYRNPILQLTTNDPGVAGKLDQSGEHDPGFGQTAPISHPIPLRQIDAFGGPHNPPVPRWKQAHNSAIETKIINCFEKTKINLFQPTRIEHRPF